MKILLKKNALFGSIIFLFLSCTEDTLNSPGPQDFEIDLSLSLETNWPLAYDILHTINAHRDTLNLSPITMDQSYASALAVEHTKYMIGLNEINHDDLNVRTAALISKGATFVGENVANGYVTADEVVLGWLGSATHRDVLQGNYTHAGFGVLEDDAGVFFYTMLLYQ